MLGGPSGHGRKEGNFKGMVVVIQGRGDGGKERMRAASSVVRPSVGRKIVRRSERNETGGRSLDYIIH